MKTTTNLELKLEKLFNYNDKTLKVCENRCWFTCYEVVRTLTKSEKKNVKFVEGRVDGRYHCWLEVDSKVYDYHYYFLNFSTSDDLYKSEKVYSSEHLSLQKEGYELRYSERFTEKLFRVRTLLYKGEEL